ncbi:hypothetical protein SB00610_03452 [Klebsiella quasipneumoniae subsp. similipneumoniae]|nr:hypothetical protein SB00610_03452 [Klebsiella quasipneumoniae subsp. similipneumoniae]
MAQRLADDLAQRFARIHRAEGVLKHQLNIAAEGADGLAFQGGQRCAAPDNIAVLRRFQAHQHPRQGALAAAAAPEQGHRFAGGDGELDLVQDPAVVRVIVAHPGDAE